MNSRTMREFKRVSEMRPGQIVECVSYHLSKFPRKRIVNGTKATIVLVLPSKKIGQSLITLKDDNSGLIFLSNPVYWEVVERIKMKNFTDEELDQFESYCTSSIGDHYLGYVCGQALRVIFAFREQRGDSQHKLTQTRAAILLAEEAEEKYRREQEENYE